MLLNECCCCVIRTREPNSFAWILSTHSGRTIVLTATFVIFFSAFRNESWTGVVENMRVLPTTSFSGMAARNCGDEKDIPSPEIRGYIYCSSTGKVNILIPK